MYFVVDVSNINLLNLYLYGVDEYYFNNALWNFYFLIKFSLKLDCIGIYLQYGAIFFFH